MDKNTFSFELEDELAPNIVIANLLGHIDDLTNGYVNGNIKEYDGEIIHHNKGGLAASIAAQYAQLSMNDTYEKLGAQETEVKRYEVYLSVKNLDHYKY